MSFPDRKQEAIVSLKEYALRDIIAFAEEIADEVVDHCHIPGAYDENGKAFIKYGLGSSNEMTEDDIHKAHIGMIKALGGMAKSAGKWGECGQDLRLVWRQMPRFQYEAGYGEQLSMRFVMYGIPAQEALHVVSR